MSLPIGLVHIAWRTILGWVDRITEPPIMRKRVNDASEVYFAEESNRRGASEADQVLGLNDDGDDDDDDGGVDARRIAPPAAQHGG
jgi:hypothetical protein